MTGREASWLLAGAKGMAKTSPDLIPGAAAGELAHGSLRLWDAIAISVSVLAPGMAMLLNVSGVAAVSGGSTPLAALPCMGRCTRRRLASSSGPRTWRWPGSSSASLC
jgi:hypothetical protein